jgi:hypothetical protein
MTKTQIYRTYYPTKLQAGACWTGPYQAALRDTSCASKKPDWRSRHAAAPHVLPTPRLPTSLRRCVAFLRPTFSASFLPGWRPQWSSARMCPLIPRGHLAMCPHPAASLITLTSSTRFRPDVYRTPQPPAKLSVLAKRFSSAWAHRQKKLGKQIFPQLTM